MYDTLDHSSPSRKCGNYRGYNGRSHRDKLKAHNYFLLDF